MKSVHVILFVLVAAADARQNSGKKDQSNLNTLDDEIGQSRTKRISRALPGVDIGSGEKNSILDAASADDAIEELPRALADSSDDSRTFHGTHPQKFEQFVDLLAIKGAVKQKAASCAYRVICNHWSRKSSVIEHADQVKKVLEVFAIVKDTYSGAAANGLLRKNCTEIYEKCGDFIRVVTSLIPKEDPPHEPSEKSTTASPHVA